MRMGRANSGNDRLAFRTFLVLAFVAFCLFAWLGRYTWFALDEWYLLARSPRGGLRYYLGSYNQHWVTLPLLLYRLLWRLVGLNSYRPYQACILMLHVTVAFLLRAIMRRVGVRPWTATLVASILLFFGSGSRNILVAFQITLVGSIVFGLVHLLLSDRVGALGRFDVIGLVAGLMGLMCSGVGVSMVFAVGVAAYIRRGWRVAAFHTIPLGIVYFMWRRQVQGWGYRTLRPASIGAGLDYAFYLARKTLEGIGQLPGVSVALVVMLGVGFGLLCRSGAGSERRRQAAMPLGLLVGAAVFVLATGLMRGAVLIRDESRYVYVTAALLLPALGLATDAVMRRWRACVPIIALLGSIGIVGNVQAADEYVQSSVYRDIGWYKHLFLYLPRLPVAREVPGWQRPERVSALPVTIGWLLDGVASGRIPEPSRIAPGDVVQGKLRLSLHQMVQVPSMDHCKKIAPDVALDVHLDEGEWIGLDRRRIAMLLPASELVGTPPPFIIYTVKGMTIWAESTIDFRIVSFGNLPAERVCGPRGVIRGATRALLGT